ncbi:MAG: acetyl-CoA C-acetyltransferase [Nocardioidaceae bacterium]|nr:acetyl-CoA C-acetyltransferase [Nocardioidaceae bacterium]
MADAFIFDHLRTPRGRGKSSGSLHEVKPVDLVVGLLDEVRRRNPGLDPHRIDDLVLGVVSPLGDQGGDIAKTAALAGGLPETVAGVQLNRFCASGLVATNLAATQVMSGQAKLTVGGGVESMSRVPMGSASGPWATNPQVAAATYFVPQGISADLIATLDGHTRDDVDGLAEESQKRAAAAWEAGFFAKSIVPVRDINGVTVLDHDEYMRPGTTRESLAKLKPSFEQMGRSYGFDAVAVQKYPQLESLTHVHHAGNSSGIVDGAAAILLGSKEAGEALGLKPRARIRSFASIGSEPTIMLTGPSESAKKALDRAGMTTADIDLWEINEAFASMCVATTRILGIDEEIVNVSGSGCSLGHPIAASGARMVVSLVHELRRRGGGTGVAAMCAGGGMSTAVVVEVPAP